MKNRMIPISISAADFGMPIVVWMRLEPRSRMAMNSEYKIMSSGFMPLSHATVMAVKPAPPPVSVVRLPSAPLTCKKPAKPQIAPLMNIVRRMMRGTFMPA